MTCVPVQDSNNAWQVIHNEYMHESCCRVCLWDVSAGLAALGDIAFTPLIWRSYADSGTPTACRTAHGGVTCKSVKYRDEAFWSWLAYNTGRYCDKGVAMHNIPKQEARVCTAAAAVEIIVFRMTTLDSFSFVGVWGGTGAHVPALTRKHRRGPSIMLLPYCDRIVFISVPGTSFYIFSYCLIWISYHIIHKDSRS